MSATVSSMLSVPSPVFHSAPQGTVYTEGAVPRHSEAVSSLGPSRFLGTDNPSREGNKKPEATCKKGCLASFCEKVKNFFERVSVCLARFFASKDKKEALKAFQEEMRATQAEFCSKGEVAAAKEFIAFSESLPEGEAYYLEEEVLERAKALAFLKAKERSGEVDTADWTPWNIPRFVKDFIGEAGEVVFQAEHIHAVVFVLMMKDIKAKATKLDKQEKIYLMVPSHAIFVFKQLPPSERDLVEKWFERFCLDQQREKPSKGFLGFLKSATQDELNECRDAMCKMFENIL